MKKNLRDSYKQYKTSTKEPVECKQYLDISTAYIKFLMTKIFAGEEVFLPARLGTMAIKGRKQNISIDEHGNVKGLAPDWARTKKLWAQDPESAATGKIVYHTNPHTNGLRYRFYWSKNRVLVKNKTLYSLKFSRTNKRELAKRVNSGSEYLIKY